MQLIFLINTFIFLARSRQRRKIFVVKVDCTKRVRCRAPKYYDITTISVLCNFCSIFHSLFYKYQQCSAPKKCIFNYPYKTFKNLFFGIIIRMYYAPKEHNPPHLHAYFQDYTATLKIHDCEVIEGKIPIRQLRMIQTWIEIRRDELLADWELCQNGEKPFQIEPLK